MLLSSTRFLKLNSWFLIGLFLILPLLQTANADKPKLILPKTYDEKADINGWLMSEKLDGIRGFWTGKKLITKSGKPIKAPSWFLSGFPPFAIDGELWTGRQHFSNISSIVLNHTPDKRWHKIKLYVFEVPNQSGGILARLNILQDFLDNRPSRFIRIIKQIPIKSKSHMQSFLNSIVKKGGEGLIVRDPNTPYVTGRLSSVLKVKQHLDAECKITEILQGKGKFADAMGSVKCEMSEGKIIKIGTGFNNAERNNPPKIGTIITFKYYGLTKNAKPKFPVFLRVKP